MTKVRADALVVARGLADSRTKAQALILAGRITSGTRLVPKPGALLPEDAPLAIVQPLHPFVSRGGVKLAHALEAFSINPAGWVCLDVGASTGGFTDCLLQRGAARVYAVDVGKGQIDARLAADDRVMVAEGINARRLSEAEVPVPVDLAVIDVSFIGLAKVLPAVMDRVRPGGGIVALIKPQFEAGPKQAKGGVVKDPEVHLAVLQTVAVQARALELSWRGVTPSPLTGPAGNVEFLMTWVVGETPVLEAIPEALAAAVMAAPRRTSP